MGNKIQIARKILRNFNVLNIVLMAITTFSICYAILPFFDMNIKFTPRQVIESATEQTEELVPYQSPPLSDFLIIGELNLFHPERKIPVDKKNDIKIRPEIVLYGTLVTDGMSLAYIEDKKNPTSSPGRGNRQRVVKKGDTISGFILKEIGMDMIRLEQGEDTITVLLSEKKERISRDNMPSADKTKTQTSQTSPQRPAQQNSPPTGPPIITPPKR